MKAVLLVAALASCGSSERRPVLCALGDSVTYGAHVELGRVPMPPPEALQALLARAPAGHPWRNARVENLGISASWTAQWLSLPPTDCDRPTDFPLHGAACRLGVPYLEALRRDYACDGYLVMLGFNDWLGRISVAQSADNLAAIASALSPAPVWIASPPHATRADVESRGRELREELLRRHLLTGIDPPQFGTDSVGFHPDTAGAAAMGGLWFGVLSR